ncbi:MAG: helix-turn-helix transcriptional regulator [Lachnospiraceae bacterium]|nr:helix-turn-helix transcriptional regulator [Lachnospiraceae bacterium]
MTQLQPADKPGVSDKTVSKWETAKGYPDITLLESIARVFGISVSELIQKPLGKGGISGDLWYNEVYGPMALDSGITEGSSKSKKHECFIAGSPAGQMRSAHPHFCK